MRTLLKNCMIIDGQNTPAYMGNIIISGETIEEISRNEIIGFEGGKTIDCQGKYVAPGFIDSHSHNDWFIPYDDAQRFFEPFIRQGVTTFIAGNCGYAIAGYPKDVDYRIATKDGIMKWTGDLNWYSFAEFFKYMENRMCSNMAFYAGHCTLRSVVSGPTKIKASSEEIHQIIDLLNQSMEEGAIGVSLGLMYEPSLYAEGGELQQIAECVAKHGKVLATHVRSYSSISTNYPMNPFSKPHNLIAVNEMLDLAKRANAKLQLSHQIFVGRRTFKTVDKVLKAIDGANQEGLDVKFDIFSPTCGPSIITVLLPKWFKEIPRSQRLQPRTLKKLKRDCEIAMKIGGFGYDDIQLTWSDLPGLEQFIGLRVDEIARKLNVAPFDAYIEMLRRSDYSARILMYQFSNDSIISKLSKHPLCLFGTDAWVEDFGVQNPALTTGMTGFIKNGIEGKGPTIEETVYKMTGAPAEHFGLKDRGRLQEGFAADICVLDVANLNENNLADSVTHVFMNGKLAMEDKSINELKGLGAVLKA
jgi:N-acyl-D-amino-acid deacylase